MIVFFIVVSLILIIVLSAKFYLIYYANIKNNNFGNILDRMNSVYLLSQGDPVKFKKIKDRLYYSSNYADEVFIPDNSTSKFKLNLIEYMCAWIYVEFGIAMLNQTPINSKKYIVNYSKDCIQKFLSGKVTLEPGIENTICIHFRCSDIPFNRLMDYNIYDCEWYKRALNIAMKQNSNLNKIYIVSCNVHRDPKGSVFHVSDERSDRNQKQCMYFVEQYAQFIKNLTHLPVDIKCSSVSQDLYNLQTCGALICTTGSFAYYAGLTSSNVMIVSNTLGRGWKRPNMIVLPGGKINHSHVQNYYDKTEMEQHLKCV